MGPAPATPCRPGGAGTARARVWRAAVLDLRLGERRRVFPTGVHAGHPGSDATTFSTGRPDRRGEPAWDHALRSDVVAALLTPGHAPGRGDGGVRRTPAFWLTRCGPLTVHDDDVAWLSAARAAYGEADLPLRMAVVTHAGWYDPVTGDGRQWRRLRP